MALESACLPIPSEIIMPFSGYLVAIGKFALWPVIIWGAVGNLIGSIIAYFVGIYGGRAFIKKYGKYILLSQEELDKSENFFKKYGSLSIFFSRLLPIVRTFISLPAGIARMPFWKFCFYTLIGSLPWSAFLTYTGIFLGENWRSIEVYFRRFDWLIGILIIITISYWLYKKLKSKEIKRGVNAIIADDQSRILILKRSPNAEFSPNLWDLPGGKAGKNESLQEATKRETKEESNLDVELENDYFYVYHYPNGKIDIYAFRAKLISGNVQLDKGHTEFKWILRDDWETLNYTPSVTATLKELFK